MPENVNVEGYEDLKIRLPESCKDTTSVQLAVALSHLKVAVVMRCKIYSAATHVQPLASSACSTERLHRSTIRCTTVAHLCDTGHCRDSVQHT